MNSTAVECGPRNLNSNADIPTNIDVLTFSILTFSGQNVLNETKTFLNPAVADCCAPNKQQFSKCFGYIEIPSKYVKKGDNSATLDAINKCITDKGGKGGNTVQLATKAGGGGKTSAASISTASLAQVGMLALAITGLLMH